MSGSEASEAPEDTSCTKLLKTRDLDLRFKIEALACNRFSEKMGSQRSRAGFTCLRRTVGRGVNWGHEARHVEEPMDEQGTTRSDGTCAATASSQGRMDGTGRGWSGWMLFLDWLKTALECTGLGHALPSTSHSMLQQQLRRTTRELCPARGCRICGVCRVELFVSGTRMPAALLMFFAGPPAENDECFVQTLALHGRAIGIKRAISC